MDILLSLTPTITAFVVGVYATRVRANRFVSLKRKGLEVKGVSEATLLKIIEKSSKTGNTLYAWTLENMEMVEHAQRAFDHRA